MGTGTLSGVATSNGDRYRDVSIIKQLIMWFPQRNCRDWSVAAGEHGTH